MSAMLAGLTEASMLDLFPLEVEDNLSCTFDWASGITAHPWRLADPIEDFFT